MTDSTGTTSWSYDNANRLTGFNSPQGNMTYTYDNANRRATMVEGVGTTTYNYDAAGQVTSLVNPYSETTSWTYDNAGRTTQNTLGNGAYTSYGYDSRNRINSANQKKSDNTTISSESYVYDYAGNMTSKTIDSVTTTYGYDNIDQLTGESRTGYVCTYTYDANGNRLTKTLNNSTDSYTYDDADKMLTAGAKSYGYDAAGRTTSVTVNNQTTTLAYDYEGRITQITYPNNSTNSFTYNALDTRVGKVDSGGTKTFKRGGAEVTDPVLSDGAAAYTPGVSERRSGVSKFYHGDYLNSVTRETDSTQTTTATKQYDAFGLLVSSTGSSASPFGFAGGYGYQEDPDSGLKLLGHRYYDSSTGRFLTRDPAKDGRNWYAYCGNRPCNSVDPAGTAPAWLLNLWLYLSSILNGNFQNPDQLPDKIQVSPTEPDCHGGGGPKPPPGPGGGGNLPPMSREEKMRLMIMCMKIAEGGSAEVPPVEEWKKPWRSATQVLASPVRGGPAVGPGKSEKEGFDWDVLGVSVVAATAIVIVGIEIIGSGGGGAATGGKVIQIIFDVGKAAA